LIVYVQTYLLIKALVTNTCYICPSTHN